MTTIAEPLSIPLVAPTTITLDDVVAAYRKHGIRPQQHGLLAVAADGSVEACAVGALLYDKMGMAADTVENRTRRWELLGLSQSFVVGVEQGFDGGLWAIVDDVTNRAQFDEGFAFGAAVRRWAFGR